MKKTYWLVSIILVIGILMFIATALASCNYQMADLNYDFDYAYIDIGGTVKKVEIKSWRDYEDGEQIQITDKDGNIYLTSSFNCTLVKEGK